MRIGRMKQSKPQIPTCSMSDIAFLLIVFFMVTTVFNKDQGLNLTLPVATQPDTLKTGSFHVTITQENQIRFEGKEININALKTLVMQEYGKDKEVYAIIKADESVQFKMVKQVLDIIQRGYVNKVAFGVKPQGKGTEPQ